MMEQVNAGSSLPVDEAGIVTRDVPCRRCSYNLRGLNYAGKCPECGTPVGVSIYGNLLRFSDPAWVDKLARGVNLILWGIVAAIVAVIVGVALARVNPALPQIVGFLGGLVGFVGAWLLTEPDPGTQEQSQTMTARRIVRFALLVGMLQSVLTMFGNSSMHPMLGTLVGILILVAAIIGMVGQFAQIYYLEKLAMRIPDEKLARRARTVRWGYGISLSVVLVGGALMSFVMLALKQTPSGGATPLFVGVGCVIGLAGLCALGFGIVYLIMLFAFNKALEQQSEFARQTWAMITAPASMGPPPIAGQA